MDFDFSPKVERLRKQLLAFMDREVYPAEKVFERQLNEAPSRWQIPPVMEELKEKARADGLWNLFLPESELGAGLTNLEYAPLCEIMGRSPIAPEVFNCSAPDTGNMETLVRYATPAQQERWLKPLLAGEIRSAFAMTEPAVASSDATNIEARIEPRGQQSYVINARKWWTSGAMDPRCKIFILMGKTDPDAPRHQQQSMILVPRDTPGVNVVRALDRVRLRRRAARPRRGRVQGRARAGREHPVRRGARLRDRAGTARAGPHPPLHADDRPGRALARGDGARGSRAASPSAGRSPIRASSANGSPTRAWRSSRRVC